MSWGTYVTEHSGNDINRVVAAKIGVTEPNVSRWKRTDQVPRAETVAAFARAYGRPVLEAFVAAGFLTAREAKARPSAAVSLDQLSDDELLAEVRRRMRGQETSDGAPIGDAGPAPANDDTARLRMAARTPGPHLKADRARRKREREAGEESQDPGPTA